MNNLPIWFKVFLFDPAAFLMVLQSTIYYQGASQGIAHVQQRNERLALAYSRNALLSVQRRLADSETSLSIGVVIAVVCFMVQCVRIPLFAANIFQRRALIHLDLVPEKRRTSYPQKWLSPHRQTTRRYRNFERCSWPSTCPHVVIAAHLMPSVSLAVLIT